MPLVINDESHKGASANTKMVKIVLILRSIKGRDY